MRLSLWLASLALQAWPLAAAVQQAEAEIEEEVFPVPWQAQIYSSFAGWTEDQLQSRDGWDLAHKCGGSLMRRAGC